MKIQLISLLTFIPQEEKVYFVMTYSFSEILSFNTLKISTTVEIIQLPSRELTKILPLMFLKTELKCTCSVQDTLTPSFQCTRLYLHLLEDFHQIQICQLLDPMYHLTCRKQILNSLKRQWDTKWK